MFVHVTGDCRYMIAPLLIPYHIKPTRIGRRSCFYPSICMGFVCVCYFWHRLCCHFIEHENPSIDALQRCWAHENVHTNVDILDDHFAEHNTSFTVLFFCLRTPSSSQCELVEKPISFISNLRHCHRGLG